MRNISKSNDQWRWVLALLIIGAAVMLFACSQEGGQPSDLSKKAPPSLGAIANVDGSDEGKKDANAPQAGTAQTPAQNPAGGQPPQAAPKQ